MKDDKRRLPGPDYTAKQLATEHEEIEPLTGDMLVDTGRILMEDESRRRQDGAYRPPGEYAALTPTSSQEVAKATTPPPRTGRESGSDSDEADEDEETIGWAEDSSTEDGNSTPSASTSRLGPAEEPEDGEIEESDEDGSGEDEIQEENASSQSTTASEFFEQQAEGPNGARGGTPSFSSSPVRGAEEASEGSARAAIGAVVILNQYRESLPENRPRNFGRRPPGESRRRRPRSPAAGTSSSEISEERAAKRQRRK